MNNRQDLLNVAQALVNTAEESEYVVIKRKDLDALCAAVNQAPKPEISMLEIYIEPAFGRECICVDGPGDGSGVRFDSSVSAEKWIASWLEEQLNKTEIPPA